MRRKTVRRRSTDRHVIDTRLQRLRDTRACARRRRREVVAHADERTARVVDRHERVDLDPPSTRAGNARRLEDIVPRKRDRHGVHVLRIRRTDAADDIAEEKTLW